MPVAWARPRHQGDDRGFGELGQSPLPGDVGCVALRRWAYRAAISGEDNEGRQLDRAKPTTHPTRRSPPSPASRPLSRHWTAVRGPGSGPLGLPLPAPSRNPPGTCSRMLRSTTLRSNSDQPLTTMRWPCGHFGFPSTPKPTSSTRSISSGPSPSMKTTIGRAWVRGRTVLSSNRP
jgi:hypothetical protein